jgi:predicted glycosyltransferase
MVSEGIHVIWFDLATPKSVMFFIPFIREIENRGKKVLVTAREGDGYKEVVDLLNLYSVDFVNRGYFGGANLGDKLKASIHRQLSLMEYIEKFDVTKLVCLCSVDANRVAFGLGIPIINFYDIPLSDHTADFKKALPQARLTLPLSTKAFRPYMVPQNIFERFSLDPSQIYSYNFLDVVAWLHDFKPDIKFYNDFISSNGLNIDKPTIVVREEEFKASYVLKKYPMLYDGLKILADDMNANIVIIPRYESEHLEKMFPDFHIIKEKIIVQHLLAFCDLFIGGGGTLNSEACFFGTPAISTRSFISHYDKLLIDNGLMEKADTVDELVSISKQIIGKRNDSSILFNTMNFDIKALVDDILS